MPLPADNLRIKYYTFPIKAGQKAVVRCQPEQEIFNRFLKVKYWEIFRNDTLIATVTNSGRLSPPHPHPRSFSPIIDFSPVLVDRYSLINATKYPELHIRDVTENDLLELRVRCILQSIVDESREFKHPDTSRLTLLSLYFQYEEVRSQSSEVNVLAVRCSVIILFYNQRAFCSDAFHLTGLDC